MPITFADVGGAEPSTVTFRVGAVSLTRNSTVVQQEILVLGDPQTTNGIARVVAAAPVSTEFGLIVRIAGGPSSAVDLAMRPVFSSTSTDNPVRPVFSSTAADNPVTVAGYSTSAAALVTGPRVTFVGDNSTAIATSGATLVVAAPTSGNHLQVYRLHATNSGGGATRIAWRDSSTGPNLFSMVLPQYGVQSLDLKGSWHLTSTRALNFFQDSTAAVYWTVGYQTTAD